MSEFSRSNTAEFGSKGSEGLKWQNRIHENSDDLGNEMQAEADGINSMLDSLDSKYNDKQTDESNILEEQAKSKENEEREAKIKYLKENVYKIFG